MSRTLSRVRITATLMVFVPVLAIASSGIEPPTVEVRSRQVAPGEPLRIVVTAPGSLESLAGEFRDQAVFLSPTDGGRRWSGWTMVGLDAPPGEAHLQLRGRSAAGGDVSLTHTLTIEPKEFPEERLDVASKYVEPPPEVEQRLAAERAKLSSIYETRAAVPELTAPFLRPVAGQATSIFGKRRIFNGKPRSPHPGLDLRAAVGTPVRASGPGVVVLAQDLYYSGNTVILDHGGGLFTLYAHLSAIDVTEGDHLAPGHKLGLSGSTGRVTGPHLHWGAKIGRHPFDPTALLDQSLFD